MTSDMDRAKRPVSAALAGPYGHPFHPILVTVPIGAWIAASVFDLASHVVDDPDFLAQGASWLIAIGILGALAAAAVGLLDLAAIPTGTPAFRTVLVHMSLNVAVVLAYAAGFLWRRSGDGPHGAVALGPLLLSLLGLLTVAVSGYLGGKLAYRYGVRVAEESVQATGFQH